MADPALLETLSNLSNQIDQLSTNLSPLLKTTNYSDLISSSNDTTSPLVKAKLDITISYALHDLIWVYLKTSGIDPTQHPVMQEIERLKQYFSKLKTAESPGSTSTSSSSNNDQGRSGRMQIDKKVAARFINHAIASKKARIDPDYTQEDVEVGDDAEMGIHTRFNDDDDQEEEDQDLEQVERLLEDDDKEEEEEIELEEEEKEKEKEKEKKKGSKRKILDPFAGYDQPSEKRKFDSTTTTTTTTNSATPTNETGSNANSNASSKKSKKKDKQKKLKMKK